MRQVLLDQIGGEEALPRILRRAVRLPIELCAVHISCLNMSKSNLSEAEISAIVEMALSDHTAFDHIQADYGLSEKDVKALMRTHLKPGSYRAWRKRVRALADRRETYK